MTFFVLPIESVIHGSGQIRQEKYIPALGVDRQLVDFGANAIVWANTSAGQDTTLGANADVIVVPPLDNVVALVATKNALEALNIPAQWITGGMTYRAVLRVLVGMAAFYVRTVDTFGTALTLAGNLDKTLSQLTAGQRSALSNASDSLGLDRSSITVSTTVREALRIIGQQFANNMSAALSDL